MPRTNQYTRTNRSNYRNLTQEERIILARRLVVVAKKIIAESRKEFLLNTISKAYKNLKEIFDDFFQRYFNNAIESFCERVSWLYAPEVRELQSANEVFLKGYKEKKKLIDDAIEKALKSYEGQISKGRLKNIETIEEDIKEIADDNYVYEVITNDKFENALKSISKPSTVEELKKSFNDALTCLYQELDNIIDLQTDIGLIDEKDIDATGKSFRLNLYIYREYINTAIDNLYNKERRKTARLKKGRTFARRTR